jgi:hypothetical protein
MKLNIVIATLFITFAIWFGRKLEDIADTITDIVDNIGGGRE